MSQCSVVLFSAVFAAVFAAFPSGALGGSVDLRGIPPVRSVDEIEDHYALMRPLILNDAASGPLGPFDDGYAFVSSAEARLALGKNVDEFNRTMLDPTTVVDENVGTDFHDIFFCQRTGDYDFALRGLVAIMYHFGDKPWLVWPQTRRRILDYFLTQKGNHVLTTFSLGICGTHPETENHILMTESSRYLTNQLILTDKMSRGVYDAEYDNEANGMNAWMLQHLQQFFRQDFYEFNARPYQAYAVMAIENLADFAGDARVKLAAEMLLNYLDAKYAVSNDRLRRYVPFRRQPQYVTDTDLFDMDDESQRFVLMAGATELLGELSDFHSDRMLNPLLGSYRTPALILDLIVNREHARYFQMLRHTPTAVEIYASQPEFLLSAGGIFNPVFDFFSDQMDAWAVPTSLMPTGGGSDASLFVRFLGQSQDQQVINTCVAPGFACGLNPVIPSALLGDCTETQGAWTFLDFTWPGCSVHYGFFAAVYQAPCDTSECKREADSFGFLEAAAPSDGLDYATFKARVLALNDGVTFHSNQENEYKTSTGHSIKFIPLPSSKTDWSIHALDQQEMPTNLAQWPMAFGDVIHADGSGLIEIHNPFLHQKLILDMTDPMVPRRSEAEEAK